MGAFSFSLPVFLNDEWGVLGRVWLDTAPYSSSTLTVNAIRVAANMHRQVLTYVLVVVFKLNVCGRRLALVRSLLGTFDFVRLRCSGRTVS